MGAVQEFVQEYVTKEVISAYIGAVSIGALVGARIVWKNFYKGTGCESRHRTEPQEPDEQQSS